MTQSTFPFHRDPEIMGGALVFVGTRVPVETLLEHLQGGHSLAEFLHDFPSVGREQAIATLEVAKELLSERVPVPARPKNPSRQTLQFKVTLRDVEPSVWRRIEVPASYSFWDLHVAIQDAMGWLDCHLHVFRVRDGRTSATAEIGIPDPDGFEADRTMLPGWEVPVAAYLSQPGDRALYEYDFGDSWTHDVILEAIGRRTPRTKYPRCTAGGRACPTEDCGGPPGYADLLATLADPGHREYADMVEWAGGPVDPEAFNPATVRFDNPRRRWRTAFTEE